MQQPPTAPTRNRPPNHKRKRVPVSRADARHSLRAGDHPSASHHSHHSPDSHMPPFNQTPPSLKPEISNPKSIPKRADGWSPISGCHRSRQSNWDHPNDRTILLTRTLRAISHNSQTCAKCRIDVPSPNTRPYRESRIPWNTKPRPRTPRVSIPTALGPMPALGAPEPRAPGNGQREHPRPCQNHPLPPAAKANFQPAPPHPLRTQKHNSRFLIDLSIYQ